MATKEEIRQRVGERLGVVEIGQALESQDQLLIDEVYDEVYGRLKEKDLASWALDDDVPTELAPYFRLMMEEKLLIPFSVTGVRFNRIKLDAGEDGNLAMANLAELVVPRYESTEPVTDY